MRTKLTLRLDDQLVNQGGETAREASRVLRLADGFGLLAAIASAGLPVTHTPVAGERVTMAELFRAAYDAAPAADVLRRHLRVPLSVRERERKERQLAAIA